VARGGFAGDQEVLIVTLVNSAVDNFGRRVAELVKELGLLPHVGYRVRTLHGLAHDVVRERPALVNLANDFQIVDEREAQFILQEAAEAWVSANPYTADSYFAVDLDDRKRDWVRREHWPRLVSDIGAAFIRQAKDLRTTPPLLRENLDALPEPLPLLEMGEAIYESYQRALAYRGAVDYDDLIRLALLVLSADADYLARLHYRWPYILEDEAQDSSALQEQILRLLAGAQRSNEQDAGNWVRVGDPNQAIYETFTTASPRFLRDFLVEPGVDARELPNSGRSMQSIMDLANHLVDWTRAEHPVPGLRDARRRLSSSFTPPGDPQPNLPDDPAGIQLRPAAHGRRGVAS
jgi:DNA helicase-2/ATP-dependent DNA helicase PcrA